ncbi:MAG: hypothetical protein Q9210_001778 [Variospora velana]
MLPEQDSGTNYIASTNSFADPTFDTFLTDENSSIVESQTPGNMIKQDQDNMIKQEHHDMTNQGFRQYEQHIRRETQQQHNMPRPGPPRITVFDQFEDTEFKELRSALAAEQASTSPFRLQVNTGIQRPFTPPTSINKCQFPITPESSPLTVDEASQAMARSRTFDSSPIKSVLHPGSVEKYIHSAELMKRSLSYPEEKSSFEVDLQRILNSGPSPPASARLVPPSSFNCFPDISTLDIDFGVKGMEYDSSHYSPTSSALTPQISSFESSPEMTNINLFGDLGGLPDLSLPGGATALSSPQSSRNLTVYPSPPKEKTHRRNQSTATVDETDGTNQGTGITEDEISTYVAGPRPDNRYMCTYEDCNKLFGRKENIRSHIQTHLGDRQWRCNHCHKRFVRQHDLKRHAKIHTGQKPHTCPCGNGFARHDALTRHRQRNTCVGGFGVAEGIPQSPSKRGRPKKRPDMETRRDKAAKTRERALEKASGSSVSGSSVYSAPSPEVFFEELTTNGMRNVDNMVTIQSVEGDEVLEAINSMSPEMIDEYLQNLSKDSSPFSEFEAGNLFGVDKNAFDMESTYDATSQWLL